MLKPRSMVVTPYRIHFGDMAQDGIAAVWNNQAYTTFREQPENGPAPKICRSFALYPDGF